MSFVNSKAFIAIIGSVAVLFILLGAVGPVIIESIIRDQSIEKSIMTEDTHESWAHLPGENKVKVERLFMSYNFTNPLAVIFEGEQPVFQETGPYVYIEKKDFMDREYEDGDDIVSFNVWQRFEPSEEHGTTGDEVVDLLNLGPLTAWEKAKNSHPASIAISVLSGLFMNLNESLLQSMVAGGIGSSIYNADAATQKAILTGSGINLSDAQFDKFHADTTYGWNPYGLKYWVDIAYSPELLEDDFSFTTERVVGGETFNFLQNYFNLSYDQMVSIHTVITGATKAAHGQIKLGYCDSAYKLCSPELISAAQWTQIIPTQGQTIGNSATTFGVPEIKAFYATQFANSDSDYYVSDSADFNEDFSVPWAAKVMAYITSANDDEFTTETYALLNIGNLGFLWTMGQMFDAGQETYAESAYIKQIMDRFELESKEHTYVFWNYMKYVVAEVGQSESAGGSAANAVLGKFVSGGIQKTFEGLTKLLLPLLTASGMQAQFTTTTCNQLFAGLGGLEAVLCGALENDDEPLTAQSIMSLNVLCQKEDIVARNGFLAQVGLLGLTEANFDTNACGGTYGGTYAEVSAGISTAYSCEFTDKCTKFELAAKQWAYGAVTTTSTSLPKTDSVANWFPDLFPAPFEYYAVSQMYKNVMKQNDEDIFVPTMEQVTQLLSPNKLFAKTVTGRAFIWDQDEVTSKLFFPVAHQLLTYFRYITFEISFGGIKIQRPVKEAFFGYKDNFLTSVKAGNPQTGGNPSISDIVRIGDPNPTEDQRVAFPQKMYTGKKDKDRVRNYKQINGIDDLIYSKETVFDGYEIQTRPKNPWAAEFPLYGHDGSKSHAIQEEGDKNAVFISSINFVGVLDQIDEIEQSGLDCFRYEFSEKTWQNEETNPKNVDRYFDGPNGLLNLTGNSGSPTFNSQTHFFQADQALTDNITVYNTDGNIQKSSKWDQTYINTEKYSGASLSVRLNMQINFQMKPDILFPLEYTRYLPVYYLMRDGNWTDSAVDHRFGTLKTALTIKLVVLIVGLTLGGILAITTVLLIVKYQKSLNNKSMQVENIQMKEQSGDIYAPQKDSGDIERTKSDQLKGNYQSAALNSEAALFTEKSQK